MVLHDPVTPGTDAYMRIYNTDGSESGACGNGTRCVAWAMMADPIMSRPVEGDLVLETEAGLLPVERVSDRVFTVDMGPPRLAWNEIPLRDPYPGHPRHRPRHSAARGARASEPVGGEHGQPARDLLGRRRARL